MNNNYEKCENAFAINQKRTSEALGRGVEYLPTLEKIIDIELTAALKSITKDELLNYVKNGDESINPSDEYIESLKKLQKKKIVYTVWEDYS